MRWPLHKRKLWARVLVLSALSLFSSVILVDRLGFRDFPSIETSESFSCKRSDGVVSLARPNLHDAVYLQGHSGDKFEHYLLVASEPGLGILLGSDRVSALAEDWVLVSDNYHVHEFYESDDAISFEGRHYVFEEGQIFSLEGDPAFGSNAWRRVAEFPADVDDVGVFFDGEKVHLFGEFGDFAHGFDGTSIAYFQSSLDFNEWTLVDDEIAKPGGLLPTKWGIGDATVSVLHNRVLMITDIESRRVPYHLALWVSPAWGEKFKFAGIVAAPTEGKDKLDNHRVQDGEFVWTDDGSLVLFANWRDIDGQPGSEVPRLPDGTTRFVGSYFCEQ